MRSLVIILIFVLSATLLFGCGKAPTGEADYNQLRQEIDAGTNPPPEVPEESERERPEGGGSTELGL